MEAKEAINKAGELLKDRSRRCRDYFHDDDKFCMVGAAEHVSGQLYHRVPGLAEAFVKIVRQGETVQGEFRGLSVFVAWDNASPEEQDAIVERMINYNG